MHANWSVWGGALFNRLSFPCRRLGAELGKSVVYQETNGGKVTLISEAPSVLGTMLSLASVYVKADIAHV